MSVNDAIDIRARSIKPAMKKIRGIWHTPPLEHVQILVDEKQISRRDLIEADAELLRIKSAGPLAAISYLSRKSGVMTAVEQNATCQCKLFEDAPLRSLEARLHALLGALHEFFFGQLCGRAHL